jgi:hypothetical protein
MRKKETPEECAERRRRDERWAAEQREFRALAERYTERVRQSGERRERRRRRLRSLFLFRRTA